MARPVNPIATLVEKLPVYPVFTRSFTEAVKEGRDNLNRYRVMVPPWIATEAHLRVMASRLNAKHPERHYTVTVGMGNRCFEVRRAK